MEIKKLRLDGLLLLKPQVFKDPRGYFIETFQEGVYKDLGIKPFPQDNHSHSKKGCIRGMHFQTIPGQAKLMRAAVGKIYDVVVDIRPGSPTFGEWEAVILDDEQHEQLYIPVGFAHGFCVLSEEAHVMYKVSSPYQPAYEKGFRWNDPDVNITWPIESPIVSDRDQNCPFFKDLIGKEIQ
jgi:dTDP-4-dehydrorhamnose 3,5-epimerase